VRAAAPTIPKYDRVCAPAKFVISGRRMSAFPASFARHAACDTPTGDQAPDRCTMPQRIRDFGLAALALAALFVVLTGIDNRVPAQLTQAVTATAGGNWREMGPIGMFLMEVSADPTLRDGFVVAMVVSAAVLLVLMVKMK